MRSLTYLANPNRGKTIHYKSFNNIKVAEGGDVKQRTMAVNKTNGPGRVKRKEYLLFVLNVREEEYLARQRGLRVKRRSTWELRQQFEREHGEIFLD